MSHSHASSINPEAGLHAVTSDPAELAAGEAATRRSWEEFPYYARRYGERGWRFGLSDSAWIATLCALPREAAVAQLRWLAGVLAARGMPSYLLERHLEHLYAELARTLPSAILKYAIFERGAQALRRQRLAAMSESELRNLSADHEARTARCADRVPNLGVLLAAAVADERSGVPGAVEAIARWACDPAHFSAAWIEEVQATLHAARSGG